MRKITAALLGAGGRGIQAYGPYAISNPNEIQFTAVAEPDRERREKFKELHNIKDEMRFSDWRELLDRPQLADALLICTQDRMHFEPTLKAMEKGYHILLEKPISPDPAECALIGEKASKYDKVFSVCYVARYSNFFSTIKKLLDEGRIGKLINIVHTENVAYWHQAHSFVRGNWRNSDETSPMILQKSCHDMDVLLWYIGAHCKKVSSFGMLTHFKRENAPDGAPDRCLDGCHAAEECQYYAPKIYLTDRTDWPTSSISLDTGFEARVRALREGPYGRCVYHCDNNVVDHQVINMEFENEVTVAFTMCGLTYDNGRTIKLMGTQGEIRGIAVRNEIEVTDFNSGRKDVIHLKTPTGGHGGADYALMSDFIKLVHKGRNEGLTSAATSIESHLMAFASEKSRIEGRVISMEEYIKELKSLSMK